MSKVKIQGNASGTGVLTVEAPNTNTDRTITLPDSTGTIATTADVPTSIVDNGNATAITIDANENVGIGVVPESGAAGHTMVQIGTTASVLGSTNSAFFSNNYYYDGTNKYITTNEATRYKQGNDGSHQFHVAPSGTADSAISWTTAMTIDNNGNIRFLNNIENSNHGVFIESSSSDRDAINCKTSTTAQVGLIHFYNPNGMIGYVASNGTSTQYITSSDYRLKENVVPMTGSIDRLKALNPSRFNFIADPDTTVDGFLAHEAQEVVPEAVSGEKDAMKTEEYEVTPAVKDDDGNVVTEAVMGTREVEDYQGIDQAKLVPLLTSALQEAVAKIEALEARVTQLENN